MVVYIVQVVDHDFRMAEAAVFADYEVAKEVALERIEDLKDLDSIVKIEEGPEWLRATIDESTQVSINFDCI